MTFPGRTNPLTLSSAFRELAFVVTGRESGLYLHQAGITSAYLRAFAFSAKSFRKGSWFVDIEASTDS
jgi:hypothetical protein